MELPHEVWVALHNVWKKEAPLLEVNYHVISAIIAEYCKIQAETQGPCTQENPCGGCNRCVKELLDQRNVTYNRIAELERIVLHAKADAKAMFDELGYAGEWPCNLPPPSRVTKDFIDKFREYKKTLTNIQEQLKALTE